MVKAHLAAKPDAQKTSQHLADQKISMNGTHEATVKSGYKMAIHPPPTADNHLCKYTCAKNGAMPHSPYLFCQRSHHTTRDCDDAGLNDKFGSFGRSTARFWFWRTLVRLTDKRSPIPIRSRIMAIIVTIYDHPIGVVMSIGVHIGVQ